MRNAEIQSYRRALEKAKNWPFALKTFSYHNVPSLGSGSLSFHSPVTIIAGGNGSGKTTIVNAIWASLDPEKAFASSKAQSRLQYGSSEILLEHEGTDKVFLIDFAAPRRESGDRIETEIVFLDSATEIARLQTFFARLTDEEDLINGIGALEIGEKDLDDIKWISGKEYQSLKLYEIEDVSGDFAFFEAVLDGKSYSSQTMGDGELAVLHIWWRFFRSEEKSIFLIEEPEVFISPRSQSKVADFMIVQAIRRKHTIVITSHSPKLIAAFGVSRGIYLYRNIYNVAGTSANPHPSLLEEIGLTPVTDVIIYVEDEAGAELLHYLLESIDINLSRRCEIVHVGGEGQISSILRRIPSRISKVRVLGGYDGDQRGKIAQEIEQLAFYLPGDRPIELLMKSVLETNTELFERNSGLNHINQIVHGLKGLDSHDWFEEFCKQIGRTKQQTYPIFFQLLFADADLDLEGHTLIGEIKERLAR